MSQKKEAPYRFGGVFLRGFCTRVLRTGQVSGRTPAYMSLTPELCGFHGAYAEETLLRKKTSEEKHYPPLCKVHGNKPTIIASHSWRY
mgnify:CR=1 FL=1